MNRLFSSPMTVLILLACLISAQPAAVHAAAPSGTVVINGNAASASSSLVTLTINASDGSTACPEYYPRICGTVYMQLSSDRYSWSDWQPAQTSIPWLLHGNQICAQFVDGHGFAAPVSCDTIQIVNDTVSISFSDGRSYFTKIADACDNAVNGQEISLKEGSFAEDVILARAIDLSIIGGYDSTYGVTGGISTINGNLEIASDNATSIANIEIAGTLTISNGTLTTSRVTVI